VYPPLDERKGMVDFMTLASYQLIFISQDGGIGEPR